MRFYVITSVAGEPVVGAHGFSSADAAEAHVLLLGITAHVVKAWYASEALCTYLYNLRRREARRIAREARKAAAPPAREHGRRVK